MTGIQGFIRTEIFFQIQVVFSRAKINIALQGFSPPVLEVNVSAIAKLGV